MDTPHHFLTNPERESESISNYPATTQETQNLHPNYKLKTTQKHSSNNQPAETQKKVGKPRKVILPPNKIATLTLLPKCWIQNHKPK